MNHSRRAVPPPAKRAASDARAGRVRACATLLVRNEATRASIAYSPVNCAGEEWKMPAPETWEAIRKAATTAGTLISLKN
jgi:hypothetical protein